MAVEWDGLSGTEADVPVEETKVIKGGRVAGWVVKLAAALLLFASLATLGPALWVSQRYQGSIYTDPQAVPSAPVAIVFGAALQANGEPSWMLADRIEAAVDLYKAGKVQRILMTGDNARPDYDEVTAMKQYAVERGVPADRINLDHAGFRTYDSCYRARAIFGIREAVLVTQGYHLPRALYLAHAFGIQAVGLKGGRDRYPRQSFYDLREAAADIVMWYEVHFTHPLPRYLGEPIDLADQS